MTDGMKKQCYIILVLGLLSMSCSLKEQSYTQVDDSYITDASLAQNVLYGVYKAMNTDGVYRLNLTMLFDCPNDEIRGEGNHLTAQRQEAANAFSSTSSYVQDSWSALYKGVYNANAFLEMMEKKLPEFSNEDQMRGSVYIAEARALRALYYFELVRWFGHVPLLKSTAESSQSYDKYVQADPVEVYKFIETDLKYAIENLPWADEDAIREDNSFRFSKGAAMGLLVKVYATWAGYPLQDRSKWSDAATLAGELVGSGHHSLLADYDQLWKNAGNNVWDSHESLIEQSYWSPLSTTTSCGRVGNFNGVAAVQGTIRGNYHFAFMRVVPTFIAGWKDYADDKRWAITFADYEYRQEGKVQITRTTVGGVANTPVTFEMAMDESTPGWQIGWRATYNYRLFPRKWDTEVYVKDENQIADNNLTNVNWYVLRYADVLLLYAEALNERDGAPSAEAFNAVNMVRRRGFGLDVNTPSVAADLPSTLGFEDFRKAIRDERSYELAFEGHRRQDLVRWGIYPETVADTYVAMGLWHFAAPQYYIGAMYTKKGKSELLPIPQREKDLCPQYDQNPGWDGE